MPCDQLTKRELLDKITRGIASSDWRFKVLSNRYPFIIKIQRGSECYTLRIFVLNYIRRLGRACRNAYTNEYIPAVEISGSNGVIPLLLTWHNGYDLLVGYDLRRHQCQVGEDVQSIQVTTESLCQAHQDYFALHLHEKKEILFVFQPALLCEYAIRNRALHSFLDNPVDLKLLYSASRNPLQISERELRQLSSTERSGIVLTLVSRIREIDFVRRILSAYSYRCGMCLELQFHVSVVRITQPTESVDTDDTSNGVALCALHRKAFEAGLLHLQDDYRIVFETRRVKRSEKRLSGRWTREAESKLRPCIALPAERDQWPSVERFRQHRLGIST